jgi:hypothetical protein
MTRATDTPTSQQSSALDLRPDQRVETTNPDSVPRPRGLRPRGLNIELLGDNIEKNENGRRTARPATLLEKQLIVRLIELEKLAASLQHELTLLRDQAAS